MPKFNVIVTRDITESVCLEIDAIDGADAEAFALAMAQGSIPMPEGIEWEIDADSLQTGDLYITGCDESE